jgi:hypothetical protein
MVDFPNINAKLISIRVGRRNWSPISQDSAIRSNGKVFGNWLAQYGISQVPSYIHASGVPETGFQTQWPVGDAHWSRLVGLPDVRGATTKKGKESVPNASASVPEMVSLGPWFNQRIAQPMGMEAVPAQAVIVGISPDAASTSSACSSISLRNFFSFSLSI